MVQYTKDEYIKLMDEANLKAQADPEYIAMMTEVDISSRQQRLGAGCLRLDEY
ncbi:MAG: hypothetical protein VZQ79_08310 [Ruminococcus sp.]|nr:hypothetical protein [Ruminococcus sp.]